MKFKREVIEKPQLDQYGKVIMGTGKVVSIPLNDAAKASDLCQEAIDCGAYTPKKGESIAEMKEKNKKHEQEMAAKGIGLPRGL